ncbi:MAG: carboxypeptidase-like regulatory domain-containing protein [Planctomycetota bacterium]|jgi:hypothetical protein
MKRNYFSFKLILVVILLLLITSLPLEVNASVGTFYGTVTDKITGEPILHAYLSVETGLGMSKGKVLPHGRYLVDVRPGSDRSITVDAKGYKSQTKPNLSVGNLQLVEVNFQLMPLPSTFYISDVVPRRTAYKKLRMKDKAIDVINLTQGGVWTEIVIKGNKLRLIQEVQNVHGVEIKLMPTSADGKSRFVRVRAVRTRFQRAAVGKAFALRVKRPQWKEDASGNTEIAWETLSTPIFNVLKPVRMQRSLRPSKPGGAKRFPSTRPR